MTKWQPKWLFRATFEPISFEFPAHLRPPVTFAYYTGCRKGEILKLRLDQIDFAERPKRGCIHVRMPKGSKRMTLEEKQAWMRGRQEGKRLAAPPPPPPEPEPRRPIDPLLTVPEIVKILRTSYPTARRLKPQPGGRPRPPQHKPTFSCRASFSTLRDRWPRDERRRDAQDPC